MQVSLLSREAKGVHESNHLLCIIPLQPLCCQGIGKEQLVSAQRVPVTRSCMELALLDSHRKALAVTCGQARFSHPAHLLWVPQDTGTEGTKQFMMFLNISGGR